MRSRAGPPTCVPCSASRWSASSSSTCCNGCSRCCPYSLGLPPTSEHLAFNTAISFVTNTNWQSYSPELTLGYTVQIAGLAVQNFVSAAVGIAIAVALVRGFAYRKSGTIGNFWVDLTRASLRILLPVAAVFAVILIAGGAIQNFNGFQEVTTLTGGTAVVPGGPVASQEVIKLLGTNGGGFFNTNSAHPFENPTAWTNLVEILLMLAIPFSLTRTFGRIIGDKKQGVAIALTMTVLFLALARRDDGVRAGQRVDGGQGGAIRHPRARRCSTPRARSPRPAR